MTRTIRIGSGGIGAGDRVEPGVTLANSGFVDYMGYDCLAERTLALAQVRKVADPSAGYDERLPKILQLMAGFIGSGGRIAGNFGAANVDAAGSVTADQLRSLGLGGTRIGLIHGDDVLDAVKAADCELPERGCRISDVSDRLISAHAYIGAGPVAACFDDGAQFVIGGRIADPSVWVGAICHALGWPLDDWDRVATATLVGHLLEGGIGRRPGADVSLPLGYPLATVTEDGAVEISKLPGTGGPLNVPMAKLSLAHEIHDPTRYLTPDVVADVAGVWFEQRGDDRVRVHGATGSAPTDTYRVLVGLDLGWKVVGEVSFGGPGCVERARRQADEMRKLLANYADVVDETRYDIHGVDALFEDAYQGGYPADCRLRVASRVLTRDAADEIADVYWRLYGQGGGGVTRMIDRNIGVTPALLPRNAVDIEHEVISA